MGPVIRLVLAVVFFAVGMTGLVLPILPGWIFLFAGAALIFPRHRWTEWMLRKSAARAPKTVAMLRRWGMGANMTDADDR